MSGLHNEIDYTDKFITIGQIKARIKALIDLGRVDEPEDEDDGTAWDEHEELHKLGLVEHDLSWCWDEDNKTLIHTDKFDDFARQEFIDIGDIRDGSPLMELIDWDEAADFLLSDYKKVALPNGNDYWTRA